MTALLQLFWSFFQVGLFSFGGGYAAMPLIQAQVVDLHGWLNMTEFADIITISQMTPGPIAINSATFVGMRIAGIPGALVATVGCVLPSCIVSLLLAKLYLKYRSLDLIHGALGGLRPAVIALIASAGVTILLGALQTSAGGVDWLNAGIFAVGLLILLLRPKTDPILGLVGAGLVGLVGYQWLPLGGRKRGNDRAARKSETARVCPVLVCREWPSPPASHEKRLRAFAAEPWG